MEHIDLQYQRLVQEILQAPKKENRTGISTYAIACRSLRHDMADGFPLLTTKKMGMKTIAAELECFIKGLHTKKEFHERNCHIWDEWCDPQKVPYGNDETTKQKMMEEDELGRIYGVQWRDRMGTPAASDGAGIDQFKSVVETLKTNPFDRRMIVNAWNPTDLPQMALPPCHCLFQFDVTDGKLSLQLYQRSCDSFLGVPFNIASYAILLMMIAQVCGLKPGTFVWTGGSVHLYSNHLKQAKLQLTRAPRKAPTMVINPTVKDIFNYHYEDFQLIEYDPHPTIKADISV